MQNLDTVFLEAKTWSASWPLSRFRSVLYELSVAFPTLVLSWDEWAGEDWATFSINNAVVILLRKDVPLAFVAIEHYKLGFVLQGHEVEVMPMTGWEAKEFSLSASTVEIFHEWTWRLSHGNGINMTKFSAWDLWWATI